MDNEQTKRQELKMIQNNLKLLKQPTGQLKTAYNHNPGLIRVLKTINTLMFHQGQGGIFGHLILPLSAQGLYRACGKQFIINYNIDSTKRLVNLLCIAGAIKVLSWKDLPHPEKRNVKFEHIYYQCLDLREADFSRINKMDCNTKLNYATVATCYGEELAGNVFSTVKAKSQRDKFDELNLKHFINKVKAQGAITYKDAVSLFKDSQHGFKYGELWFKESLEALFLMGYFKGQLKLTTYAKSRATGLDVTGNTKVIEPVKSYAMTCL